jgi:hypothetical protein
MNSTITYAVAAGLVIAAGNAWCAGALPPGGAPVSTTQIKQIIREAHTADQYRTIAAYYDERHAKFSKEAADEKMEWVRRSENTSGPAGKYPRPVDVARNLYDYYAHEADEAAMQASKFYQFAAGAEATSNR